MRNYIIYIEEENGEYCIVEIFNRCDVQSVQKELINNGYTIISLSYPYMKVSKEREYDE